MALQLQASELCLTLCVKNMKAKVAEKGFHIIRTEIHKWKPVPWASYDDDEPDLHPDDPNYEVAKSMLADELDSTVKSIVKQLFKVKTKLDLAYLLHKSFFELDERVKLEECKAVAERLYKQLKESKVV